MKYNGIELVELTMPQIFDPPKQMLVWHENANISPGTRDVCAIIKCKNRTVAITTDLVTYSHCAEIPKPRRATIRELAKWLSAGYGEYRNQISLVMNSYSYDDSESNEEVSNCIKVRKWDDTEWHEPTIDYMGIK